MISILCNVNYLNTPQHINYLSLTYAHYPLLKVPHISLHSRTFILCLLPYNIGIR